MHNRLFGRAIPAAIPQHEWRGLLVEQRAKVSRLLQNDLFQDRAHPIYNFITIYYHSLKPAILYQFSPGLGPGVSWEGGDDDHNFSPRDRRVEKDVFFFDPKLARYTERQIVGFENNLMLMKAVHRKAPALSCYGLHEWAMLYSPVSSAARLKPTQQLPFRVTQDCIREVVESSSLRCTHFDAFRFFTPPAALLNRSQNLSRASASESDQPGCLHVHMDLFKWAIKIYPFVSSCLLVDALELALRAREIDMRASPYDLSFYTMPGGSNPALVPSKNLGENFSSRPIMIEHREGKLEYQRFQVELYAASIPIRERLIQSYEEFLEHAKP